MVSICNAFSPCIVEGFLSTRNLHVLIWSHIVVLGISTQLRRGCSFHGSRCLLAISPRYYGMLCCPFNDNSKLFISPLIACGCRCQSCVARFHSSQDVDQFFQDVGKNTFKNALYELETLIADAILVSSVCCTCLTSTELDRVRSTDAMSYGSESR